MVLLLVGTGAILLLVFYIREETRLDRAILAVTAVGSQGSGLVTAAMGVLRFQSKSATTMTTRPGHPGGDSGVVSETTTAAATTTTSTDGANGKP